LCISAVYGRACAPEGDTKSALMLLYTFLYLFSPPFLG
jgi:hypothetical protein